MYLKEQHLQFELNQVLKLQQRSEFAARLPTVGQQVRRKPEVREHCGHPTVRHKPIKQVREPRIDVEVGKEATRFMPLHVCEHRQAESVTIGQRVSKPQPDHV